MNNNTFKEIYLLIEKIPTYDWKNGKRDCVFFEKENKSIKIFDGGSLYVNQVGQVLSRSQRRKLRRFHAHVESELAAIAVHNIVRDAI